VANTLIPWYQREDETQRKQTGTFAWGVTFQRTYTVPHGLSITDLDAEAARQILPARGALGIPTADEAAATLTAARVLNWRYGQKKEGGIQLIVDWGQIVLYAGVTDTTAGLALLELRGSRQTREDRFRYGTRIYAASRDTESDNIPKFFTDSIGVTGMTTLARRKVGVQKDDQILPGVWLLTASYVGFVESELMHLRDLDDNAFAGPSGKRVFATLDTGAITMMGQLKGKMFPGTKVSAYRTKAIWRPFNLPDIALVEAYYGFPGQGYPRKVGYARVTLRTMSQSRRKVMRDLDKAIVEGWDNEKFWQVTQGSNNIPDTATFLRIETAIYADGVPVRDALYLRNTVNKDGFNLVMFGYVPPETFRMASIETVSTLQTDIVPINYYIEVEDKGWNTLVKSAPGVFKVYEIPVFDDNDVQTGKTATVKRFIPKMESSLNGGMTTYRAAEEEARRLHPAVDWGFMFDNLQRWKY